jgi:hypothetical protein
MNKSMMTYLNDTGSFIRHSCLQKVLMLAYRLLFLEIIIGRIYPLTACYLQPWMLSVERK